MVAFRLLRSRRTFYWLFFVHACALWLACIPCIAAWAQDLSWVNGAIERTKSAKRESLPAWQYDPRVNASNVDASLNAIVAVNPDRLFAVGDRGLILQSIDGGRSWHSQSSPTSMNLYGVTFLDEQHGVAAGGTVQPLSQSSLGIVLVTIDAGNTWQAITTSGKSALPRLTGIAKDERSLRIWGDFSSAHGSGVFESQDQGRTWQPIAAPLTHVQAVARERHGLILGLDHAGRLAQIPHNLNRNFVQLASPNTPIHALTHNGSQWFAVGDAAAITSSRDGANWVDHSLPLSEAARGVCSFQCITHVEQNLWVAGTPGSILLHSADAGASWRVVPIEQSWSITAIEFVDRHRGWLVTAAGSIWATRDGGASWFAQRAPLKRLGTQVIASSAGNISWPALVASAWQARQATDLIAVHRENIEDTVDFSPDAPASLSTLGNQVGLISAINPSQWPSAVGVHSAASASRYNSTLTQYLAMRLRVGRPSVILIDDLESAKKDRENFVEQVHQAAWLAELDQPNVDWLQRELHLAPWKPNKLLSVSTAERADFTISSEELLRDSGLAMQDVLAPIFGKQSLGFPNTSVRCLKLSSGNSASRQNLFSAQERSPESTRAADLSKIGNLQLVMGRAHRDKAWQALAPTALNIDEEINTWTKKLDSVLQQTPKHESGTALVQLAERCLIGQHWERWSVAIERASAQVPLSDCARYGSLQIMRLVASEEFLAWQSQSAMRGEHDENESVAGPPRLASSSKAQRLGNPLESDPFESPAISSQQASPAEKSSNAAQLPVQLVSGEVALSPIEIQRISALRQVVSEFNRLSEADRGLVARPDMQMAHYARRRALSELAGDPAPDPGSLQALTTKSWLAGWPQVAAQEFIMAGGRMERPTWSARAVRTNEAPLLNGLADDPCWQKSTAIELANPFLPMGAQPAERQTTRIMFAYDDEFLYGWMTCPQVGAASSEHHDNSSQGKSPRRYDMDLDESDHVVLQIDTDRDYASACELAINRAGHTYDRSCGYSQWNPRWHVDVSQSNSAWSAEFAIRLSDLSTRSPVVGSAWAISAFRYLPGGGVQSWSQLRSAVPKFQGNGLLVFE